MFRQEKSSLPESPATSGQHGMPISGGKKPSKKLYVFGAGIIAIVVIATALLIPQGAGSSIQLNLNYTVGEHMAYDTTNVITNQMYNTSINIGGSTDSQSYNSTFTIDVFSFNGENYTLNQTTTSTILGRTLSLPLVNVSKTSYYNNFIAPGAPQVFYNSSSNPTISAYLAKQTVKVGDVWQIPVNTGNSSLGLTGELALKFTGFQDLTVPAGTYKTFSIEISSSKLNMHADPDYLNTIHLSIPENMTLQLNGNTYLEQGTCRLIKANLTQETTFQTTGINSTSIIYTERTLVEHTKP